MYKLTKPLHKMNKTLSCTLKPSPKGLILEHKKKKKIASLYKIGLEIEVFKMPA